jgi:hypothetical protein
MSRRLHESFKALVALLLLGLAVTSARAHGIGTPRLLNVASGPYLLSVWTDPDPLRADETHVVVGVTDPETRAPIVSDVEVTVSLTSVATPSVVVTEIAGTDEVNRLLYAAEFNNRLTEGRWRVGVSAAGERGSGDAVEFEVDIGPARGLNWLWVGVGGMAVLVLVWVMGSMRSGSPARARRGKNQPVE